MKPSRRTTVWRYHQFLELSVLVLTLVMLFLAVGFALAEINRRYLDLRLADASRAPLFLENRLTNVREGLVTFADLAEAERSPTVLKFLSAFSDLYRLDSQFRVAEIYQTAPDNPVVIGFSFSGTALADDLQAIGDRQALSAILRGREDVAPSIYLALRRGSQFYLGRLKLTYVQDVLNQFARVTGLPVLLVAKEGGVMLSSDPELRISAFDLNQWVGTPSARRTLAAAGRHWIPAFLEANTIGAIAVTLIPAEPLETQRNVLLGFLVIFTGGFILLMVLKHRLLHRWVMQPLAAVARSMRDLDQSQWPATTEENDYRFEELADIHARSQAMAEAIRQQEQSLAEATLQAQSASLAKSAFLAHMSHEIRTPLNAILGFAQVLVRDPDLKGSQRDSLATIQRSGEHLLTLVNNVLDMAKIEAGRMTLQTAPFDLARLLMETEALFRQNARDRGLTLTIEAAALPRRVEGDALKLRQVLINLIGNAVKFTPAGSVTLRVEAVGDDATRFSVLDTGLGIAPEELARLFEPFTQTETGRWMQGGTGLGLALSTQYVRLMGGELTADSTPGQGSCFTFTLRLASVPQSPEPMTVLNENPVVGLEPYQPVCRVLIADDLPVNRELLRALLDGLNAMPPVLEFREAVDGWEAVAVWEQWQPQVIFMDIQMPVLSGEEATRRIKARMRARPNKVRSVVVALTGSAFDENRDHLLTCGFDEVTRKPLQAEELFAILEQRVGLRFIRLEELPPASSSLSPEELARRLRACPADWRANLKDAVELGDFVRITALLEQISDDDVMFYDTLVQWTCNYDLEAFTVLCGQAEDHEG